MSATLASFTVQCPSCKTGFPVDPGKVPEGGIHAICSQCDRTFLVSRPQAQQAEASGSGAALGSEGSAAGSAGEVALDDPGRDHEAAAETGDHGSGLEEAEAVEEAAAPPGFEPEFTLDDSGKGDFELEEGETAEEDIVEPAAVQETGFRIEEDREPEAPEAPDEPAAFEDLRGLASEAQAEGESTHTGGSTLSGGAQRFGRRDPQDRAKRLARVLVSDIIAYYPERFQESRARGTVKEDFEAEVEKSWKEYVDQVGQEMAESTPYFTEALNEILAGGKEIF